jgi:hypothetical protein
MKKVFYYAVVIALSAITCLSACKGSGSKAGNADTGQTHVSNPNPADSSGYTTTAVETGGQDTTMKGIGNKATSTGDSINTNPK